MVNFHGIVSVLAMFSPVMVLVDCFIEPWCVQQIMRIVCPSIQVQKYQHYGDKEVGISILIYPEVDCAIVAIDDPASEKS